MKDRIDISVIIPAYNVEEYLPACIESLTGQEGICLEIILIDDGSTDSTDAMADQYAKKDSRIKVVHRQNGGASAARNAGLALAQGQYIAFVDSDDWVKEKSLRRLYDEATKYQADVVMGNIFWGYQSQTKEVRGGPFYKPAPKEMQYIPFSGKECFVQLVKAIAYTPMVFNYIYRRSFLENIQVRFEEGVMFEDELWTPTVISHASKMVAVDIDFYYYRQRAGSVMNATKLAKRLHALFRISDLMFEFADRFDFSGEDGEFKSWLYVIIFRFYSEVYRYLPMLKDSSYIVPSSRLERFWRNSWQMTLEAQKTGLMFYKRAAAGWEKYIEWLTSDWVASVYCQIKVGKKVLLIYNELPDRKLSLKIEHVPEHWVITTDRRYFQQADAVVFYLPELYQELENDLEKPENQIWISWYANDEKMDFWLEDPDIKDIFDFWISCPQDEVQDKHPLILLCQNLDEIK